MASYAVPLGVGGGLLVFIIFLRDSIEAAVANVANWVPVGYAFAAGMVASESLWVLDAATYVSYHLGTQEEGYYGQPVTRRALKALVLGTVATAGFLAILALVGSVIAAGGQWLLDVFPFAGPGIGGAMTLQGVYLLANRRSLGIMAASR